MANDSGVRVMLTGDNVVFSMHPRPTACYEKVAPYMKEADIRFGNLEWPITGALPLDPGRDAFIKALNATAKKPSSFAGAHMDIRALEALRLAGYDVMGLANNHHMDFGPTGSAETRKLLQSAGIIFCGAGSDIAEARRPAIIERKGLRVAFVSFTALFVKTAAATSDRPGMSTIKVHTTYTPSLRFEEQPGTPMDTITTPDKQQQEELMQVIREAKKDADAVICSIHWGVSSAQLDQGLLRSRVMYQMDLGHACVDAGADLIVGHHPHILQGVEFYKKGIICYSIGNFVFARGDGVHGNFPPETVIADCTFRKGRIPELSFFPVLVNEDDIPEVVNLDKGRNVLARLEEDSRNLGTKFTPREGKIYVSIAG